MIAQTLSNRILDRPLLPNGPIVQLGTFEDILSDQTDLRTLVVGFELEMEKEKPGSSVDFRTRRVDRINIAGLHREVKSVKLASRFRSASSNGVSTSAIEAAKVIIESISLAMKLSPMEAHYEQLALFSEDATKVESDFGLDIKLLSATEIDEFLKEVSPEYLRLVPYSINESNYLGRFTFKDRSANIRVPNASLIALSHFLPARLIGKYSIEERQKTQLMRVVDILLRDVDNRLLGKSVPYLLRISASNVFTLDINSVLQDTLKKTLSDFCKEEEEISKEFSGQTLGDLISWYQLLEINEENRSVTNKLIEIVVQGISEQLAYLEKGTKALEAITNNIYVESLEGAVEGIIQFFTSKIRYLGPLRADPQAVQKFAPSSELDDVGAKGEYAAAVYDANHNATIRWYHPFSGIIKSSELKEALDTWVSYLGVADEVKIQVAGQSGVSWHVVPVKGQKARPLTAVGVGVSQILPILVMGLLAPSDTLLLVEQPELHLHPSVQARLGDFFMGLAKCDKQCLIETHSENLVSQLRHHIVLAEGQENSDCLIYFVDQDEQGATRFNPIEISAKGNILNWPDGFFDETMLQEDRITAAGLKKRVKNAQNG